LPNLISLARILIVCFGLWYWHINIFIGAGLIAFGLTSDFIDGIVARRRKQKTAVGAIFDPIADKVVIYLAFIFLFWSEISLILLIIMGALDITSTIMRSKKKNSAINFGKWKFGAQCTSLAAFGAFHAFQSEWLIYSGNFFLFLAVILGGISVWKRF
jgi:CDP-diacylglycerol--glycerol-3-phosphate 3-phosphatidyltransferase